MEQIIEVGPMSGKSNVQFWLERHDIPATDELVDRIYRRAKESERMLTDPEIMECIQTANGMRSELAS
jgi:2-isopropylmalate synthase